MLNVPHRFSLAALALLLVALPARAADPFVASLDQDTVTLGDSVTLSLAFSGVTPPSQPNLPPLQNLEVLAAGQSTQVQIDNGRMTSTTTYTYELRPTREGDLSIPGMNIDVAGKRYTSQPLKLKVTKNPSPVKPPGAGDVAFVRLKVPKPEFYVGETVPVEIQCYYRDPVVNANLPQISNDGFVISTIPTNPGRTQMRVGNATYVLLTFRVSVSPTKAGYLALGPVNWSVAVATGPQNPFFGYSSTRPMNVASETVTTTVTPVPTNNAPSGFTGAIGNFSIASYEASPTNVAVGDPVTLKIRIAGHGGFDHVQLPPSGGDWRQFKTYPPTARFDTSDPLQIDGSKYFEQVVIPQNEEVTQIPPFTFSFFDPEKRVFHSLTQAPVPLIVRPTVATPQPTVVTAQTTPGEAPPPPREIVHIKAELGKVQPLAPAWIRRPGFLALQAIAPALWACAGVWRRRKDSLANNPRLRRRREVARLVEGGLRELEVHAAANDPESFYGTLIRLLQEQLGERLDLPAGALTAAALDQPPANRLDSETLGLLRELFARCDQFRYAPERTAEELQAMIPKVVRALEALREMEGPAASAKNGVVAVVGCLLLLASALAARAADLDADFNRANKLYEEGKYADAAVGYQKMVQGGLVSPVLYFNLGNAWFKAGQTGRALIAYRQAELLAPRDPDIRANLKFARNAAGNSSGLAPGQRWVQWLEEFSLNEWTGMTAFLTAVVFLFLTARQVWPALNKQLSSATAWIGAVGVCCLLCLGAVAQDRLRTPVAIVIVPETSAHLGPFDESQNAFTARDGSEYLVVDRRPGWVEILGSDKRTGWLKDGQVAMAPTG